ncbi:hypothetical protein GCM10022224_104410 [Nonomuraea antimicrobica]|uniref:Uncharacterized protein n=1 Tax=Nonomuraea antimicrobica TaxID=561173 RepID=A0ABP7ES77_9ACTN
MTESTPRSAEQAYDIDAYLVYVTQLRHDGPAHLVLEPYDSDHALCLANPGGCTANLIEASRRCGRVSLGELVQLAVVHENARDGYPYAQETDDQASRAIGVIIGAAQRMALDELRAEGRAELVGRLAALRQQLVSLQQEAVYTRETADGHSSYSAGDRADLYGQLIDQLDQVVKG